MTLARVVALAALIMVMPTLPALAVGPGSSTRNAVSAADPLERIRQTVEREVRAGRLPVVVFNVDGTIFDNRPRSQAILRDFVEAGGDSLSEITDSVYALRADSIDYYVVDSFRGAGIHNLFFLESALKFWADNFFSNQYVRHDVPIGGSVGYLNRLHEAGAMIVYISGRGLPNMLEGTIEALHRAGFPIATSRTLLVMKPTPRENNYEFKRREFARINQLGRVVAAFENDPRAGEAMARSFPRAEIVLIRQPHPKDPAAPLRVRRTTTLEAY